MPDTPTPTPTVTPTPTPTVTPTPTPTVVNEIVKNYGSVANFQRVVGGGAN